MVDKLIDLLDTARYRYQEYEAEKDHRMRVAKTEEEFDTEANTYETRHSFYARELRNSGVEIPVRCKDCVYRGKLYASHLCQHPKAILGKVINEDFCSYGERKDRKNG